MGEETLTDLAVAVVVQRMSELAASPWPIGSLLVAVAAAAVTIPMPVEPGVVLPEPQAVMQQMVRLPMVVREEHNQPEEPGVEPILVIQGLWEWVAMAILQVVRLGIPAAAAVAIMVEPVGQVLLQPVLDMVQLAVADLPMWEVFPQRLQPVE